MSQRGLLEERDMRRAKDCYLTNQSIKQDLCLQGRRGCWGLGDRQGTMGAEFSPKASHFKVTKRSNTFEKENQQRQMS